jgi:hypothetical protein
MNWIMASGRTWAPWVLRLRVCRTAEPKRFRENVYPMVYRIVPALVLLLVFAVFVLLTRQRG